MEENTNTETLVCCLLSDDYADKVIVTTIQKLGLALDEAKGWQQQLHAYTITHVIEDCNVLRFHVDYFKPEGKTSPSRVKRWRKRPLSRSSSPSTMLLPTGANLTLYWQPPASTTPLSTTHYSKPCRRKNRQKAPTSRLYCAGAGSATKISTRRFLARLVAVSLATNGSCEPRPSMVMRFAAMPRAVR